ALIYVFVVGQHLLPGKKETKKPEEVPETADLSDMYKVKENLFEIWIGEEIPMEGVKLKDLGLQQHDLTLIAVTREDENLYFKEPDYKVQAEDLLLVQGSEQAAETFCAENDEFTFLGSPESELKYSISTAELAEAVIPPRSPLIGDKIGDIRLSDKYGMLPIAYYRDGKPHHHGVNETELQEGDALLLYGPREKMRDFDPEKEMLVYYRPGKPDVSPRLKKLAPIAALILLGVILVAALDFFPIAISALAGAAIMVLAGILTPQDAYRAIDWKTLVLIGGMYPLGVALNSTGTADLIGEFLVGSLGELGPLFVMGGISLLAMILTQPMHNAAVAIIMTPIAIQSANAMGADPKAFCIAVIVSCSATFVMPYGHPAPFMVQEPGEYSAKDYLKFGAGLNVLALAVILLVIPLFWSMG
ncbi:MAG: SLC13 family permease, partial [Fulvivirga sp.]|nr:SLC13 family permease [Fulvivirga sp.]